MLRFQKHLIPAIIFGLVASAGISHAASCFVDTEANLRQTLQSVTDGLITDTQCPDPDFNFAKYTYFEIAADIILTQPISIPARVHLKGNVSGKSATITAEYETKPTPDATTCILKFEGDQVVLENVRITARTYANVSGIKDTVICMTGNYGKLDSVMIAGISTPPSNEFVPSLIDGVMVIGNNNIIEKSFITTKHMGVGVGGDFFKMSSTQVKGSKIGVFMGGKNPMIFNNTLSGRLGIGFFDSSIPIGQAANLFLLNAVSNINSNWETLPESFSKIYGQTLDSLLNCGACIDSASKNTIKIQYADNGTCNPTPEGCSLLTVAEFAKVEFAAIIQKIEISKPSQYATVKPSDLQIYIASPTDTDSGTVDDKNAVFAETAPKTLSEMRPEVANGQAVSGGCSLVPFVAPNGELNTILALLLCAMVAARACHSSKS